LGSRKVYNWDDFLRKMGISKLVSKLVTPLLAVVLAGCSYNVSLNTEYFKFDKANRTIESSELEREIGRFDQGLVDTIKSDYTKKREKGELTLAYSEHNCNGLYKEEDDAIFIPISATSKQKAMDAISEELAHTLTDDIGIRKGVFFSKDYQGPDLEEIRQVIEKRFQQQDLLETRKRLENILRLREALKEEQGLTKKFIKDYEEIAKRASNIDLKKKDRQTDKINEIGTSLTSEINSHQQYLQNPKARAIYTKINNGGIGVLTDEEREYLFNFVSAVCSKTRIIGTKFCALDEKISSYCGLQTQISPYDYETGSNPEEEARKEVEKEFSFKEKFGKTIYSIANFHYGSASMASYEVSDEILEILLKCRVKGKPMFKKLIEKYLVGREMARGGCGIKDIKEKLRYANKFSYNGKEYFWQEADFKIKGRIPDEFSLEFLSIDN